MKMTTICRRKPRNPTARTKTLYKALKTKKIDKKTKIKENIEKKKEQ